MPNSLAASPHQRTSLTTRWHFLDALRGFALAGIILVNARDITHLGYGLADVPPGIFAPQAILDFTVQARFVPIFAFMFGMSLFFVLQAARRRHGGSVWPMLIRLVTLFAIGLAHAVIYPGEILRSYAIAGLVVLPFIMMLPRLIVLGSGIMLTVLAYALAGGGPLSLPGLFLAGAAAAAYGLPRLLESANRAVALLCVIAAAAAFPAIWWQTTQPGDPRFTDAGALAGLVLAVVYVTGLALLWQTPCRMVIAAVFEPLGKMALSNYLSASVILATSATIVPFEDRDDLTSLLAGATLIILIQSLASRLWLSHFQYGPIEWLWRTATWRHPAAIRRPAPETTPA